MNAIQIVRTALIADAPLMGLVSGVWFHHAPSDAVPPFIVLTAVDEIPVNTLAGAANNTRSRVQADVWASTYDDASTVSLALNSALSGVVEAVRLSGSYQFESDIEYHRIIADYAVWHAV